MINDKELSKEQKLMVINHAFKEYQKEPYKGNFGMCNMLYRSISRLITIGPLTSSIYTFIPEFKPELFGISLSDSFDRLGFWWEPKDFEVRNKAFKILINEIESTN